MNQKMLQKIISITKENEMQLHIIENLTGTMTKNLHKPNTNPNGYCWMHRYHIGHGHTSKTFTFRAPGHKEEGTRADIMGGCQANEPKADDTNHKNNTAKCDWSASILLLQAHAPAD